MKNHVGACRSGAESDLATPGAGRPGSKAVFSGLVVGAIAKFRDLPGVLDCLGLSSKCAIGQALLSSPFFVERKDVGIAEKPGNFLNTVCSFALCGSGVLLCH